MSKAESAVPFLGLSTCLPVLPLPSGTTPMPWLSTQGLALSGMHSMPETAGNPLWHMGSILHS